MIKNIIAVDLGATSGRLILSVCDSEKIRSMEEIVRFPNTMIQTDGKFYWDFRSLYGNILDGLKIVAKKGLEIDSIGIDTWGVDFVAVAKDGSIPGQPRAYRDPYTDGVPEEFFRKIPKRDVYMKTGIQIMNFNSLFQLYAQTKEEGSNMEAADKILFIPDALSYLLTGRMVCESTILSTAQVVNIHTGRFDADLLETAGVTEDIFAGTVLPGTVIGVLSETVRKETGLGPVPVVAVAGHDTGSAVASVPSADEKFAYLSSGTWSLIGIETPKPIVTEESYNLNYTNEGGIDGTVRFLKNVTGMWILEQCRANWKVQGKDYDYPSIVKMAEEAVPFAFFIDPDDAVFAHPKNMVEEIRKYCIVHTGKAPQTDAQIVRCIFESLAMKYRYTMQNLKSMAPFEIERLHIIGGGSKNALLNQMTANALGMTVIAGPVEATAIGNIAVQLRTAGLTGSKEEMRKYIGDSIRTEEFVPQDGVQWDEAYIKFTDDTDL